MFHLHLSSVNEHGLTSAHAAPSRQVSPRSSRSFQVRLSSRFADFHAKSVSPPIGAPRWGFPERERQKNFQEKGEVAVACLCCLRVQICPYCSYRDFILFVSMYIYIYIYLYIALHRYTFACKGVYPRVGLCTCYASRHVRTGHT